MSKTGKAKSGAILKNRYNSSKKLYIWAWKFTPSGTMIAKVFPSKTKDGKVDNTIYENKGKQFIRVYINCCRPYEAPFNISGMYYLATDTVVIPEWENVVIMPTAKNGGFFGSLSSK